MNYFFLTGSSKGIGRALAEAVLEDPSNYIIGLSRENTFSHARFRHQKIDFAQIGSLVAQLPDVFNIDGEAESAILINNAGTLGEVGYMGELEAANLPTIYNVNLIAPALLINEFIKKFRGTKMMILNISSGAGGYPVDGWSGYCATKAGLNMLGEVVAKEQEIRSQDFRIFNLAPGVVDTNMQEKIRKSNAEQFSGVQKFINLKENDALSSPNAVAEKVMRMIKDPNQFKTVKQDIRDF